jgi:hypothetical protein
MSTNKDLANQLAAMRLKAKQSAAVAANPVEIPETPPDAPEPKAKEPAAPKLKVVRKAQRQKGRGEEKVLASASGSLERTTITLKSGDTAALEGLQTFLMKRMRKAASTSTLIRLALSYTKQALVSDAEALAQAYRQILEEDGRRRSESV